MRALTIVLLALVAHPALAFVHPDQFFRASSTTHEASTTAAAEGIYFTGAPRFAGQTCAACHIGSGGLGLVVTTTPDLFAGGYTPGTTYELAVSLSGATLGTQYATPTCTEPPLPGEVFDYVQCDTNGFALEIDDAQDGIAGSLCAAAPSNGACPDAATNSDETLLAPAGDTAFANRAHDPALDYVVTANGRASWHLWWTAPPAGTGPLAIYVSAVDGNGGSGRVESDADPYGDDSAAVRIAVHEVGAAVGGCSVAAGAGDVGLALPLLLAVALVLRRRARLWLTFAMLASCDQSATMLPGEDCQGCHENFGASGTVFGSAVAATIDGRRGATIRITDATGQVLELLSNETGNFYTEKRLVYPLRTEVELGGTTRHMEPSVDTPGCNSCHGSPPENGAAGRIHVSPGP